MKVMFLGLGVAAAVAALFVSTSLAQTPAPIRVLGCLQGEGSEQKPWWLSGVALPVPAAAPAGGGGGRGGAGGRGAGAPPAAGAQGTGGGAGAQGGGRGAG